jgi:hypothetical protein
MSSSKSESLYSVSTIQSIKNKLTSLKPSPSSKQQHKTNVSPGEKQADRNATRTDPQTVAAWAAMR